MSSKLKTEHKTEQKTIKDNKIVRQRELNEEQKQLLIEFKLKYLQLYSQQIRPENIIKMKTNKELQFAFSKKFPGNFDIGTVTCNNGAPNGGNAVADTEDMAKVYTWKAITTGTGTGVVSANFEAETHISRFQIIWNNDVVADSLFIGDDLGSQPNTEITKLQRALEYGFKEMNYDEGNQSFYATSRTLYPQVNPYPTSVKCLWEGDQDGSDDRIVYNIAMTGSGTPQSINRNSGSPLTQIPNSPSQGMYENNQGTLAMPASGCGSGSYVAEGTTPNYPASSSASWDGQINLQFTKSLAEPNEIYFRVWSVDDAQWSANSVQCPLALAPPLDFSQLKPLSECWNAGHMNGPGGTFPFNQAGWGFVEMYHKNSIYPSTNLTVGDQMYQDPELTTAQSLIPTTSNKIGWTQRPGSHNFNKRFMSTKKPDGGYYFPDNNAFGPNPTITAFSAWNVCNGGGNSVAGQQIAFNGNWYMQGGANGVITAQTGSFIKWTSFQVKFIEDSGPSDVDCNWTGSYIPDTTYYFSDGWNQGLPGYAGGQVLTGDPGQPDYTVSGIGGSPFGIYTQGGLDNLIPAKGWYSAYINSDASASCDSYGIPPITLILIGDGGVVLQTPMGASNGSRGLCYDLDTYVPNGA